MYDVASTVFCSPPHYTHSNARFSSKTASYDVASADSARHVIIRIQTLGFRFKRHPMTWRALSMSPSIQETDDDISFPWGRYEYFVRTIKAGLTS